MPQPFLSIRDPYDARIAAAERDLAQARLVQPTSAKQCECGAVTVRYADGQQRAMPAKDYLTTFGAVALDKGRYACCDHCVNHWGTDLCACGSGEAPAACQEGYDECGKPHYSLL